MMFLRHSRLLEGSLALSLTFLACLLLLAISVTSTTVHAQTFADLHDFNCNTDGCNGRYPGRIAQGRDGNLYGTMPGGGNPNLGTVFTVTPGGTFNKIYNFSGTDGYGPFSGLTLGTDGNFYGATYNDGANGYGTLFKITPAGTLTTLHNFTAAEEGGAYGTPAASKTGTYYGVTYYRKAYSITPSGTFKLLPNPLDSSSFAPLILGSDGNFYGTTIGGGINGRGSVFRMSTSGVITNIYSFDYTHGSEPYGPIVQGADGFFYGTTTSGGSMAHSAGVVFKLSTKGVITVLHEFDNTSTTDGYQPLSGLVAATDGNFYGTTSSGAYGGPTQYGVLFKITKTGTYTVLHNFDSTHGADPASELFQGTNGVIYGETQAGASLGGVLYSWNAGIAPFVSLVGFPAGSAGTVVQILGQGFNSASSVKFGAASASFTVGSDTYMTATVPANGTSGAVTVTTSGGILKSAQNYKVIPLITNFSPTSGPVGTPVTINGSGFVGASKVTFGGVKAITYSVNSAGTQISATVPTGAITGKIAVTTTGGTASKGTFTMN